MKNIKVLAWSIIIGLLIGGGAVVWSNNSQQTNNANQVVNNQKTGFVVKTTIDSGSSNRTFDAQAQEGTSALALLKNIAAINSVDLQIKSYDFGDLVEGIDGVVGDTATGYYWSFYVNDEMASVGAGDYIVKQGDKIAWKYQKL